MVTARVQYIQDGFRRCGEKSGVVVYYHPMKTVFRRKKIYRCILQRGGILRIHGDNMLCDLGAITRGVIGKGGDSMPCGTGVCATHPKQVTGGL